MKEMCSDLYMLLGDLAVITSGLSVLIKKCLGERYRVKLF